MNTAIVSHVLDTIPLNLDVPALLGQARVKENSALSRELLPLAEEGAQLARPKALYLVAYVSDRGDDFVEIEGRRFSSRVLRVNLEKAYRVFPHLATCGMELQEWAERIEDPLHRFWAETVKHLALAAAMKALAEHIGTAYRPGDTSSMNPGSLPDWPIEQQQLLFDLFGSGASRIGVRLTESMLMVPTKSVSGIRFPTTEHFESCQLCPRENCPGRRAPFEPALYAGKYQAHPEV
jgi:hypothetical protein